MSFPNFFKVIILSFQDRGERHMPLQLMYQNVEFGIIQQNSKNSSKSLNSIFMHLTNST